MKAWAVLPKDDICTVSFVIWGHWEGTTKANIERVLLSMFMSWRLSFARKREFLRIEQMISLFQTSTMILLIDNLSVPQLCWLIKLDNLIQMATMSKGKKSHTCKTCGFSTMNAKNLKQHLLIHSAEKPFSCEQCKYSSKRAGSLKRYMLIHSQESLCKVFAM